MLRKWWFWTAVAVLLLAGGGYFAYSSGWAGRVIPALARNPAGESETVLQTATVTTGNLSITADGTGVLVASSEVDLAFDSSGTLMELLVERGVEGVHMYYCPHHPHGSRYDLARRCAAVPRARR